MNKNKLHHAPAKQLMRHTVYVQQMKYPPLPVRNPLTKLKLDTSTEKTQRLGTTPVSSSNYEEQTMRFKRVCISSRVY